MRAGWALWLDWCHATGAPDLEVTDQRLRRFVDQVEVSDRALSQIRTTAREQWLLNAGLPDPWAGLEARLQPLEDSLRACPATGWVHGYRGRRDAWLLVLTRGLRFTRAQALGISSSQLNGWKVGGRELVWTRDMRTCHRCIARRWLDAREAEHDWGRSRVREVVSQRPVEDHWCTAGHQLDTNLPGWATLAPALDQYGWISGGYVRLNPHHLDSPVAPPAMSSRALTTVLGLRCAPGLSAADAPDDRDESASLSEPLDPGELPAEITWDELEDVLRRADEVQSRVRALVKLT